MSAPLPSFVRSLIHLVVPAHRRAHVVADLQEDYVRTRSTRGGHARLWLARETVSLLFAYVHARIPRFRGSATIWSRDLRLVMRGLRRGPVAAIGAAAMLSAGLLAVLISVGLTKTLLFRQVSAIHGDKVRRIAAVDRQGRAAMRLSYLEMQQIDERTRDAAATAVVNLAPVVLRAQGADIQTMAEVVDGEYFAVTGTMTLIGRGLMTADDRVEAPPVAVLAEPFWRRHFATSPSVIGQVIELNGAPFTVIGVAASLGSSSFLGASVDAWVPMQQADALLSRGWRGAVDQRIFTSFVLPTTNAAEVDARLAVAGSDLARLYPDHWRERRLQTTDGAVLFGGQRNAVTMLAAILGALSLLILAAAASNVSGVLLARAAANRRHAAIHMSMGSGRAAVIRRQLLEGAILGLCGGVFAVALYTWARTWFAEIAILPTLALRLSMPLDSTLVLLVIGIGIAAGLLLAVGPAIWATRVDLADALRDAEFRTGTSRGLARVRRLLVSAQVCLSLALIVGAALFMRSAGALASVDLGFPRDRLVAMDFDVEPSGPATSELPALAREALARAQTVPGVIAAAMSNRAPVDQSTPSVEVRSSAADPVVIGDVSFYLATARYFETVGVPLIAGRAFTEAETLTNADVAIVNEALATRLWPDGDAIDRAIYLAGESKSLRVIGVARNAKYRAVTEEGRPHLYRPTAPGISLALLARTSGDPRETLRALQRELDQVGPGLIGFFPRTLDDHLAIQFLPARAAAGAATGLGVLALVLSAVGLYGLVSWFVELRRREIGVRMALGASVANVRRLVVGQAVAAAVPGVIAGIALAIALGVGARSALFGVGPIDPIAFGVGIGSLAMVVLVAAYLPSRRATKVDPATALRE